MNVCVVFDIDGVLINVEESFHEAIKRTVPLYVQHVLKKSMDNLCVDDACIEGFKKKGGFNDDWDVTAGILYYYAFLCDESSQHVDNWDVLTFLESCQGQGLEAILAGTHGKNTDWIRFDKSPVPEGQIHPDNVVKRIFQEVYWGKNQFKKIYSDETRYVSSEGSIQNEKPLMTLDTLQWIQQNVAGVAIATGRERVDALYSLEKFSYLASFDTIITLTDVGENYKKPHPRSLEKIKDFFSHKGMKDCSLIYVGDQLDDMEMAFKAQNFMDVWPIGFLYDQNQERHDRMIAMGVANIVSTHQEVVDIIKKRTLACG